MLHDLRRPGHFDGSASNIWTADNTFLRRARTQVDEARHHSRPYNRSYSDDENDNETVSTADDRASVDRQSRGPACLLDREEEQAKTQALQSFFGVKPRFHRSSSVPASARTKDTRQQSRNSGQPLFDLLAQATSGERSSTNNSPRDLAAGFSLPSPRNRAPAQLSSMPEEDPQTTRQRSASTAGHSILAPTLDSSPRRSPSMSMHINPPLSAREPVYSLSSSLQESQPSSLPTSHSSDWDRYRQQQSYQAHAMNMPSSSGPIPMPSVPLSSKMSARGSSPRRLDSGMAATAPAGDDWVAGANIPSFRETSAFDGGIASTNVSPFTRDGMRLPPTYPSLGYRVREHSLGPVGSGRKRGESIWGTTRSTVFAHEGIDDDGSDEGDFLPPPKSGATSRRHSLATTLPGKSQIGFAVPDHHFSPSHTYSSSAKLYSSGPNVSSSSAAPAGGLRFNDDELADSLNSLQLNIEQNRPLTSHFASTNTYGSPNQANFSSHFPLSSSPQASNTFQTHVMASPGQRHTNFGLPGNLRDINALSATAQPFNTNNNFNSFDINFRPVYFGAQTQQEPDLAEFGRGIPLHAVPEGSPLYIVEFKAGRTDIFYSPDISLLIRTGDVVIVEADRGKDLGTIVHDNISLQDVQAFQKHQVEQALNHLANSRNPPPNPQTINKLTREVHPKRILSKATQTDLQLLSSKAADEEKALALCRVKVIQKNMEMEITDAEWQFDRRKLTLFYIADRRVDFREFVRELFRLYKTRIWLAPCEKRVEGMSPSGRF